MHHFFGATKHSSATTEQAHKNEEKISSTAEVPSETSDTKTLDELLDACEGAVCEVLTTDNRLFFAGHVSQRDPDFKMVTIQPYHNDETPFGVEHGEPVKVQVRVQEHWGNLVMLYGVISVCKEDKWTIFVQNATACTESRRAFRQRVDADAEILWGPDFRFRGKCQLEDISLVGVAFYSPLKLDTGRQLILSIPRLTKSGPSYQLSSTVVSSRNTAEPGQSPRWRYGCSFDPLDQEVEGSLYRDIMTLQIKARTV